MPVDVLGRFRKFMVYPGLESSECGYVIGQQKDADQDGENALSGCNQHDDSHDDAKPAEYVFKHEFGMLVPDQPFH